MSTTAIVPSAGAELSGRAAEVLELMKVAKQSLVNNFFDLGELLSEARTNNYHIQYGYSRFGDFVESQDWLDMKERQCYYLIKIVDTAKELGIGGDELRQSKVSKLKEIFSLDKQQHAEDIKQLVAASKDTSLDEVVKAVQQVKQRDGIEPRMVLHLGFGQVTYENVVLPALERARAEYGNTVDSSTGEIVDISDSRAAELIFADYLAQPEEEPETIPVEPEVEAIYTIEE